MRLGIDARNTVGGAHKFFGLLAACKAAGGVGTLCSNTIFKPEGLQRSSRPIKEAKVKVRYIHIDWDQCECA